MIIQTTLLPHKHVRFCNSLIGVAGFVLKLLNEPHTLDELWVLIDRDNSNWYSRPPFEHVVLAVDILFAIGQIEFVHDNRIRRIEL